MLLHIVSRGADVGAPTMRKVATMSLSRQTRGCSAKKGSIASLGNVTIQLSVSAMRTSATTSRWITKGGDD